MTEIMNKEFSRKSFVKGGGAMVIGFSAAGALVGAKAAKAAIDPYASMGPFDQISVDSWLIIHADNTASLKIGKVEMDLFVGCRKPREHLVPFVDRKDQS